MNYIFSQTNLIFLSIDKWEANYSCVSELEWRCKSYRPAKEAVRRLKIPGQRNPGRDQNWGHTCASGLKPRESRQSKMTCHFLSLKKLHFQAWASEVCLAPLRTKSCHQVTALHGIKHHLSLIHQTLIKCLVFARYLSRCKENKNDEQLVRFLPSCIRKHLDYDLISTDYSISKIIELHLLLFPLLWKFDTSQEKFKEKLMS